VSNDGAAGCGVAEAIGAYLDHLRVERGASPHTVAAYRRDLARYAEFLAGRGIVELAAVSSREIGDYTISLHAGVPAEDGNGWQRRPLADASVARAVVVVRGLHRFAVEDRTSDGDPARNVHPPRPARRLPKALSLDQVQAMLDAPDGDGPLGLRDRALLELLYGTGARISEAIGLDVDDVSRVLGTDLSEPVALRLLGKGSKERIVPLGSYARAALVSYLVRARPSLAVKGRGSGALFLNVRGGRLSRQSAWNLVQTAAERAGITTDVSPHTLRHSYATHLLDGGADVRVVQELLGHASVTTTQIYTLVTVDHLREVYLTAHPRAR
jgi:integrase/recombinase XerD